MSEIHDPEDVGAGLIRVASRPAPARATAPGAGRKPETEVPAWEAAMVKLSTVVAVWLGY